MKKIITLMLAAIAALTVIAGGCSGSTKTTETDSTRSETGGLIVSEEPRESTPMKLTVARASEENAIAAQSSDSYTVTATVTPSNATITDVSWALSFANPSSSWASGKSVTDYVELSAGVSSATVRCKAAFGEQIILTATAQGNTSLKANCTLDYVKRVESATVSFNNSGYPVNLTGDSWYASEVIRNYTLGVGTVTGTFTWNGEIRVNLTQAAFNAVFDSSYFHELYDMNSSESGLDTLNSYYTCPYMESDYEEDNEVCHTYYRDFVDYADGKTSLSEKADKLLRAAFYDGLNGMTNTGFLSISYTYIYNGTSYGSGTVESNLVTYNASDFYVSVTNLSLSSTSYLF